jgi:predicted amidohydrolase YtcJ
MLLTNGRFYTLDAAGSIADTLVVRDGRIAFAGRSADINPAAGERTIDLGGRAALPGLVDAHGHLLHLARARLTLDAAGLRSEDEVAALVAAAASRTPRDAWIRGRGWDQTLWPGGHFPTRRSLDRVAPGHPVVLTRIDGHAAWVNSAALHAAGISRHTADPPGGIVVRTGDGEPTGLLIDAAQDLVRSAEPPLPGARLEQAIREAIAVCLAAGLTGVHEMGVDLPGLAAYRRLLDRGHFPFRNYAALSGRRAWAEYRERGPEVAGDGRLVVRAVKLWLDGALGSRGAALHAPYCDDPGNTGLILVPPDEVERLTRETTARGFQMCVHAIGDRANTLVLDAFERALGDLAPGLAARARPRVEHAQVLGPPDIPRFARLGVLPSMQPAHCVSDMRWAAGRLGHERLAGAYAWRSLLDTGVLLAGGSDFPVEDPSPFHGIHAAVTRQSPGDERVWQPGQRMTREEAVRAFTSWNALASHQEADLGSLEPGKRADVVVLDEDVFTCPVPRIRDIAPVLTMVGGEVVHARVPFEAP